VTVVWKRDTPGNVVGEFDGCDRSQRVDQESFNVSVLLVGPQKGHPGSGPIQDFVLRGGGSS